MSFPLFQNGNNAEERIKHFKAVSGYEIDGVWYPRVTKIVEIKAKPALYHFYGEADSFAHGEEIKQKSAVEGTLIHETLEKILIGEEPAIPASISPALEEVQRFLNERSITVDKNFVEKRIFHPEHRYAGTIDALAFIDGELGILDIKTSQSIYRDYNLQTAAYMAALTREFPDLRTRWILRVDQIRVCLKCRATLRAKGGRDKIRANGNRGNRCPDDKHEWSDLQGIVELKEFPYWKSDFEAFLGAKKLWEWENEYWLKLAGYL